jgi:HD-like signal output (HDOD) protein
MIALAKLNTKQIPVLPPGITYLMQSMMDESLNFHQLAQIVERFPSIAARLIGLANSVWSSPVNPISSLEMACSRLGFSVVRSTSIALAVASPFDPSRCPAFDTEDFWCHSLLVADTANWLAQAANDEATLPPQTARAAGLLHDLGLLWLVDQLPKASNQALLQHRNNPAVSLDQALLNITGINLGEVGRHLAEAWNLPESLRVAMSHRTAKPHKTAYWEIALLVELADCLVSSVGEDRPCPISAPHLQALNIKPDKLDPVLHLLNQQIETARELAHVLFHRAA